MSEKDFTKVFTEAFQKVETNHEIVLDWVDVLENVIKYLNQWADDVIIDYNETDESFYIHPLFRGSLYDVIECQEDLINRFEYSVCIYPERYYIYHRTYWISGADRILYITLV